MKRGTTPAVARTGLVQDGERHECHSKRARGTSHRNGRAFARACPVVWALICVSVEGANCCSPISGPWAFGIGNRLQNFTNFGPVPLAQGFIDQASGNQSIITTCESRSSFLSSEILANGYVPARKDCSSSRIQWTLDTRFSIEYFADSTIDDSLISKIATVNDSDANQFGSIKRRLLARIFKSEEDFIRTARRIVGHFKILGRDDFSRSQPRTLLSSQSLIRFFQRLPLEKGDDSGGNQNEKSYRLSKIFALAFSFLRLTVGAYSSTIAWSSVDFWEL